ncbi:MAG: 3-deoxy-manno-octulosonate cytidylyltransferase [Planctomycetes bacterium]|nr:3-deoxy-manno-octulosonate cytidylyltransferase [Planctomycetota bacterium]
MSDEIAPCARGPTKAFVVIPARLGSTRLTEKMLLAETGKTLVQHTYESASRATRPSGVLVATDHERIVAAVRSFGGRAALTSVDARSGTDRIAEVVAELTDVDVFVNVQGDEPDMEASAIDRVIGLLDTHPEANIATLATPIRDRRLLDDPSCVKVVFAHDGRAHYFSRSPIPHARNWSDGLLAAEPALFHQHLGVYAYRRRFLLNLRDVPDSPLERLECLEQLRWLQAGHAIVVGVVGAHAKGIDTWDDYRAFVSRRAT